MVKRSQEKKGCDEYTLAQLISYDFLWFNCVPIQGTFTPVLLEAAEVKKLQLLVHCVSKNITKSGAYRGLQAWSMLKKEPMLYTRPTEDAMALSYLTAREELGRDHAICLILFETLNILAAARAHSPDAMYDVMEYKDNKSMTLRGKKEFVMQDFASNSKLLVTYFTNNQESKKRSNKLVMWIIIMIIANILFFLSGYSRYSMKNFRGEQYLADIYAQQDLLESQQSAEQIAAATEQIMHTL